MSRPQVVLVLAVAVLAGLLGLLASILVHGPGSLQRTPLGAWLAGPGDAAPSTGTPVIPFTVTDFAGHPVLVPAAGETVLVNYWASWCAPCREEMPMLSAAAQRWRLPVLGIALEPAADARAFLATHPVAYRVAQELPSATDSSVRLGNARGVLPYSVLIDGQRRLRARRLGPFKDAEDLKAWLEASGVDLPETGQPAHPPAGNTLP